MKLFFKICVWLMLLLFFFYETAFSGLNVPLRFFEFIMGRGSGRGVIDVGILRGQVCSFGGAILGARTAPKFMSNIKK